MNNIVSLSKLEYQEICSILGINPKSDRKATKLLNKYMNFKNIESTLTRLYTLLENKTVFVFGAGPSLEDSIKEIESIITNHRDDLIIIAVDGAANALYVNNIPIDIVVSDLDGCFKSIREELFSDLIIVVHAHGDNMDNI